MHLCDRISFNESRGDENRFGLLNCDCINGAVSGISLRNGIANVFLDYDGLDVFSSKYQPQDGFVKILEVKNENFFHSKNLLSKLFKNISFEGHNDFEF